MPPLPSRKFDGSARSSRRPPPPPPRPPIRRRRPPPQSDRCRLARLRRERDIVILAIEQLGPMTGRVRRTQLPLALRLERLDAELRP